MSLVGVDRRRIAGPEISVRPLEEAKEIKSILDSEYLRHDGRYPEQLRSYTITPGIITRAPGSVYVEVGKTKLVCSVYGPRTASSRTATKSFQTLGNVSCEINFAPFSSFQRGTHPPEAEEEDLALLLLQAICPAIRRELFPNSFLDIYITVLENDGSILSTSITAASVALIQSGIEMLDSVVACSTVLSDRVFVMDPDRTELGPTVTMAMMPNLNQITQIYLIGKTERMIVGEVMAICTDACRAIYDGMVKPALDNFIN